jgi:hypothetical protein
MQHRFFRSHPKDSSIQLPIKTLKEMQVETLWVPIQVDEVPNFTGL